MLENIILIIVCYVIMHEVMVLYKSCSSFHSAHSELNNAILLYSSELQQNYR